jgi:hypothetical protein
MADHCPNHDSYTDGCFRCKVATIQLAPSASGTRSGWEVAATNAKEKQLHKDRDAYKRLRADGLQPNSVDGSAQLEQNVKDQIEIDYKVPLREKDIPRVKEIQSEVALRQAVGDA